MSLASDANFCPGGAIIFENTAHFDRPPSAGWETIYFEFFEANSSWLKNVFFLFSYFIYCIRESVAILIPLGSNCGISFSDSIVSSYSSILKTLCCCPPPPPPPAAPAAFQLFSHNLPSAREKTFLFANSVERKEIA